LYPEGKGDWQAAQAGGITVEWSDVTPRCVTRILAATRETVK
jgi:hypothetical protein